MLYKQFQTSQRAAPITSATLNILALLGDKNVDIDTILFINKRDHIRHSVNTKQVAS